MANILGQRAVLELDLSSVPDQPVLSGEVFCAIGQVWLSDTPQGTRLLQPIVNVYAELEGHSWCCRSNFESKGARRSRVFHARKQLWPVEGSEQTGSTDSRKALCLPPGQHQFPVQITLPTSLPSSFSTKSARGGVEYRLRLGAVLSDRWLFPSMWRKFSVIQMQDLSAPKYQEPLTERIMHNTSHRFLTPWSIFHLEGSIKQQAFQQGDIVPVDVVAWKHSWARGCVVQAQLVQRTTYKLLRTSSARVRPDRCFETVCKVHEQYKEGDSDGHQSCLLLTIPTTAIPTSMSDCVWIEYFVQVTLKDPLRRFKKCIILPIMVGASVSNYLQSSGPTDVQTRLSNTSS